MKPNEQNPGVTAPSKAGDQTQPAKADPKKAEFGKPFTPGPKEEVNSPLQAANDNENDNDDDETGSESPRKST